MSSHSPSPVEFFLQELNRAPQAMGASDVASSREQKHEEIRPWDNADPRMKILFQARLPHPLHKKLQWVSQHTMGGVSMQELLLVGLEKYLDEQIAEIEVQLNARSVR